MTTVTVSQPYIFTGIAMTIPYKIIVGEALSEKQQSTIQKIILSVFEETDRHFNKYNLKSEVSKLNALPAYEQRELSKELSDLFLLTDKIVTLSNGRFDPTIEPLQKLWREALEKNEVPTQLMIDKMGPIIGWNTIHFQNRVFSKNQGETQIDLGGIAKGHCVDRLSESLAVFGFANSYVEWGGEIRTNGVHPSGRAWTVFISNLGDENPENAIAILPLTNESLATSGNYLQNWTIKNGERETKYTHILDSKKMSPLVIEKNAIASVSILASSCAFADGIATAAMLFPNADDSKAWLEKLKSDNVIKDFWIIGQ